MPTTGADLIPIVIGWFDVDLSRAAVLVIHDRTRAATCRSSRAALPGHQATKMKPLSGLRPCGG